MLSLKQNKNQAEIAIEQVLKQSIDSEADVTFPEFLQCMHDLETKLQDWGRAP